jgi:thiol-disulfide isomerase/thioredoxin
VNRLFFWLFSFVLVHSALGAGRADDDWTKVAAIHDKVDQPTPEGVNSVEFHRAAKTALCQAAVAFVAQHRTDVRAATAELWRIENSDFEGTLEERLRLLHQNESDAASFTTDNAYPEQIKAQLEQAVLEQWIDNWDVLTAPAQIAGLEARIGAYLAQHPAVPEALPNQLARADLLFRIDPTRARTFLEQLAASNDPALAEAAKARLARADLIGKPVPLSLTCMNGASVDLEQLRGKVVLVNFWATWCPDCLRELPVIKRTWEDHRDQLEVIGISLDRSRASLENFIARKSLPWPEYFDGQGWNTVPAVKYAVHSIPESWLIDKRGVLRETSVSSEDLPRKVGQLLAEP